MAAPVLFRHPFCCIDITQINYDLAEGNGTGEWGILIPLHPPLMVTHTLGIELSDIHRLTAPLVDIFNERRGGMGTHIQTDRHNIAEMQHNI